MLFGKSNFRPLEAAACAAFLAVTRQMSERRETKEQITVERVSSFSEVEIPLINSAVLEIDCHLTVERKESARKGAVFGRISSIICIF